MPNVFHFSLKELRLALGLSQKQMAGLLQMERGQLSMSELGLRPVKAKTLERIPQINKVLESTFRPETSDLSSPKSEVLNSLQQLERRIIGKLQKLETSAQNL